MISMSISRKFKILSFNKVYDFGHEFYLKFISYRTFCLFFFSVRHSEFFSWEPNLKLNITALNGNLFGIAFHAFNIVVEFSLFDTLIYS